MKSIILDDDDDDVQPLFVKFGHPFCDTILLFNIHYALDVSSKYIQVIIN